MKKVISRLLLISLFAVSSTFAACITPSSGGTGKCNPDANTLTLNAATTLDTQIENGLLYFDGSKITSNDLLQYDGAGALYFVAYDSPGLSLTFDDQSGDFSDGDGAAINLSRYDGDGIVSYNFWENGSPVWSWEMNGAYGSGDDIILRDQADGINRFSFDLDGDFEVAELSNSQLLGTGTQHQLVSVNLGGDVSTANNFTTTIGSHVVTNAKMATAGFLTMKGMPTGSGDQTLQDVPANFDGCTYRRLGQTIACGQLLLSSTNAITGTLLSSSFPALTGDISNSAGSLATTLATVNSSPGTFGSATQVPVFAVNAKGLVTSVTNTTISGVSPGGAAGGDLTGTYPNPTVAALAINNSKIANSTIDLTAKVSGALPEANGGTNVSTGYVASGLIFQDAGGNNFNSTANLTYTGAGLNVGNNINAVGENLSGLTGSQLTATNSLKTIISGNLSGDVASSQFVTTLATVNVSPGTFGSATQVPVFVVNGKGLVTSVTNTTISGVSPGGSAGGDLTGTYPNPTIAALAVTNAKIANSTIDLTAKVTGTLPIANGGTNNAATPTTHGVYYFDGTKFTNNSTLTYDGSSLLELKNNTASLAVLLQNTLVGSSSATDYYVERSDETNGRAGIFWGDLSQGNQFIWEMGLRPGDESLHIYDNQNGVDRFVFDQSGNLRISALTASGLVGTNASSQLVNVTFTGDVTNSLLATTIASNAVSNAKFRQSAAVSLVGNSTGSTANVADISAASDGQVMRRASGTLAFGAIDVSSSNAVANTLAFANGGFGFSTATTGDLFCASGTNTPGKLSDVATGQVLTSGGVGVAPVYSANPQVTTLGLGAAVSAPTATTQLNVSSSTQASARIVLSGQEFFAAGHTDTDGIALLAGVNRANNRQFWMADSARLTVNSTNPLIQMSLSATGNPSTIDSLATDGSTALPINFGSTGAATVVAGSSIALTGGDVTNSTGNLIVATVNKGLTIKSAAVSSSTANAAFVTGIVLVAGTKTVTDSYVTTNSVCSVSVVTSSGTPGTGGYRVTVASGSFTVAGAATDTSTLNGVCFNGN